MNVMKSLIRAHEVVHAVLVRRAKGHRATKTL